MTKPKTAEKSKKANNSAPKQKEGGISKLLKDVVDKVVSAGKPAVNTAKPAADAAKPAAKAKAAAPSTLEDKATAAVAAAPAKAARKRKTAEAESPILAAAVSAEVLAKAPPPSAVAITLGEGAVELEDGEVVLTDAEGRRYCRATDCDQIGLVDGYCRYHYLYFWKKIQVRKKILADGKLERYIEELTARYTDKFIELLRKDLRTEKDFMAAVQELELDDSAQSGSQADEDEAKTYLEEISGVASETSSRDEDSY